jgi:hypothetical protein
MEMVGQVCMEINTLIEHCCALTIRRLNVPATESSV